MFRRNFRARLIIGTALWIIVGQCISGFVLASILRGVVTSQFDHDLSDHIQELAGLVDINAQLEPVIKGEMSDPRFLPAGSGLYWQVQLQNGMTLRSPSLQDALLLPSGAEIENSQPAIFEGPTSSMRVMRRVIRVSVLSQPVDIRVGVEERLIDQEMAKFTHPLIASLSIVAAGLFAAACMQIAHGLQPLARIRHAVAAVRSGRTKQLPEDLPLEVMPLVKELNAMMSANLHMVERARVLAGSLAHALKMPLTVLTGEAHELAKRGHAEAAQVLFDQCARINLLIDHQTARAQASARANVGAHSNPADIIQEIIDACRRLHGDDRKIFTLVGSNELVVACDPNDLTEMIGNLIDNAVKWSREHVLVTLLDLDDTVRVVVEDDGPGIPAEQREVVFGVGIRLDKEKPGTGLGLAITQDLASLYGGRLWVEGSRYGGTAVHLTLDKIEDALALDGTLKTGLAKDQQTVSR
jgi:signal transduction histidine kinase